MLVRHYGTCVKKSRVAEHFTCKMISDCLLGYKHDAK